MHMYFVRQKNGKMHKLNLLFYLLIFKIKKMTLYSSRRNASKAERNTSCLDKHRHWHVLVWDIFVLFSKQNFCQ